MWLLSHMPEVSNLMIMGCVLFMEWLEQEARAHRSGGQEIYCATYTVMSGGAGGAGLKSCLPPMWGRRHHPTDLPSGFSSRDDVIR